MGRFLEGVAEGEELIAINHRVPQRGLAVAANGGRSKWRGDGGAPRGGGARARRVIARERERATALERCTVCTGCVTWPPPGGGLSVSLACHNP